MYCNTSMLPDSCVWLACSRFGPGSKKSVLYFTWPVFDTWMDMEGSGGGATTSRSWKRENVLLDGLEKPAAQLGEPEMKSPWKSRALLVKEPEHAADWRGLSDTTGVEYMEFHTAQPASPEEPLAVLCDSPSYS